MQLYELLFIASSQYTDEEVTGICGEVSALIEAKGGKVLQTQPLGKIRLAYPIKNNEYGTYTLLFLSLAPEHVGVVDRELRLKENVLRHMLIATTQEASTRPAHIESYVPPLTPEGRRAHKQQEEREQEAPVSAPAPASTPDVSQTPMVAKEAKMSLEELDKKLDAILKEDPSQEA